MSEAYGSARYAVARLELEVRGDQLVPTPSGRRRVDAAVDAVRATLPAIARNGDRRDRALAAELGGQIDATVIGLDHLMTAAESFDAVGVTRLNRLEVAPHLRRTEATANTAAAAHRAGLTAGLSTARRSQVVALLKRTNDTCGHQAGEELLEALAGALAQVSPEGRAFRIGGDEFAAILEGGTAIDAFVLAQDLRRRVAGATSGVAEREPGEEKHGLIRRADLALLAAKRTHRKVLVYSPDMEAEAGADLPPDVRHLSTLATALARAVDAKDSYTRSHCETVAELCVLIAVELELDAERVARIRIAGLLHDVGKIGISDAILQKPAALTPEEAAVMRTHPDLGAHIVSAAELYEEAGWILHHHERLDGRGYPDGLFEDDVPLESRIIMVADAFEAMTSDRPYRPRRPVAEALAELERHSGTQFDPACIAALRQILGPVATPARVLSAAA